MWVQSRTSMQAATTAFTVLKESASPFSWDHLLSPKAITQDRATCLTWSRSDRSIKCSQSQQGHQVPSKQWPTTLKKPSLKYLILNKHWLLESRRHSFKVTRNTLSIRLSTATKTWYSKNSLPMLISMRLFPCTKVKSWRIITLKEIWIATHLLMTTIILDLHQQIHRSSFLWWN